MQTFVFYIEVMIVILSYKYFTSYHPEISVQSVHPILAPRCYLHLRWFVDNSILNTIHHADIHLRGASPSPKSFLEKYQIIKITLLFIKQIFSLLKSSSNIWRDGFQIVPKSCSLLELKLTFLQIVFSAYGCVQLVPR